MTSGGKDISEERSVAGRRALHHPGVASQQMPVHSAVPCFEAMHKRLGTSDTAMTQIGSGLFNGSFSYVPLPGVYLFRLSHRPDSVLTWSGANRLGYVVPFHWGTTFTVNGKQATDTTIFPISGRDGFVIRADQREACAIVFQPQPFLATLAALLGREPDADCFPKEPANVSPQTFQTFRRMLETLFSICRTHPDYLLDPMIASDWSARVMAGVIDITLMSQTDTDRVITNSRERLRIVRQAEDYFHANVDGPISLADLCAVTEVGATSLNAAFKEHCGTSPIRFFKNRRLTMARDRLLLENIGRAAVKRAALEFGILELGRFSAEYKELFGEAPSATLTQSRAKP